MPADGALRRGTPAYRRLTLAMLFAGFSTFSLLYAVQPLLPLFARDYGLSAEGASLAVSLATGPLAIGILFAGILSDRIGRRPLMVCAMFAAGALTLAPAIRQLIEDGININVTLLFSQGAYQAVAMAYVAEEVDAASVGAAMGLYIAGSAIGGMGGRLIASLVADAGGWRWALGSVGLAGVAMAEAFRRLAPPSRRFVAAAATNPLRGIATLFGDAALPLIFAEAFLLMGVFVTVYNYAGFRLLAPPYALSQTAVGAVFLLYILGSASSALFGAFAGRVGPRRVFWLPIVLLIVGVGVTAAQPLALVVLGIALVTVGFFGAHSIASAWVGRRALGNRGQGASLYLFFYYMGSSPLGSAGGFAWTHAGWPGVAAFCAILGAIALVIGLWLARIPPLPLPEAEDVRPIEA